VSKDIHYGVLKVIELKDLLLIEMLLLMSLLCLARKRRLKILKEIKVLIREFIKRWSLRLKIQIKKI